MIASDHFFSNQNTDYEGEYHVDHPTIKMFWEVFDELSEDQKKAFLCKCYCIPDHIL